MRHESLRWAHKFSGEVGEVGYAEPAKVGRRRHGIEERKKEILRRAPVKDTLFDLVELSQLCMKICFAVQRVARQLEAPLDDVNTPPPKGGGFGLRLEAGLIDPSGR